MATTTTLRITSPKTRAQLHREVNALAGDKKRWFLNYLENLIDSIKSGTINGATAIEAIVGASESKRATAEFLFTGAAVATKALTVGSGSGVAFTPRASSTITVSSLADNDTCTVGPVTFTFTGAESVTTNSYSITIPYTSGNSDTQNAVLLKNAINSNPVLKKYVYATNSSGVVSVKPLDVPNAARYLVVTASGTTLVADAEPDADEFLVPTAGSAAGLKRQSACGLAAAINASSTADAQSVWACALGNQASATLTVATALANDYCVVGPCTFTFVATGESSANPYSITMNLSGTSDTADAAILAAAINANPITRSLVYASSSSAVVTITALEVGAAGNLIPCYGSSGTLLVEAVGSTDDVLCLTGGCDSVGAEPKAKAIWDITIASTAENDWCKIGGVKFSFAAAASTYNPEHIKILYTSGNSDAADAVLLAAAINANPVTKALVTATVLGAVVTVQAKSAGIPENLVACDAIGTTISVKQRVCLGAIDKDAFKASAYGTLSSFTTADTCTVGPVVFTVGTVATNNRVWSYTSPTAATVKLGATDTITAANLVEAINGHPSLIGRVTASSSGAVVKFLAAKPGIVGEGIGVAASANITFALGGSTVSALTISGVCRVYARQPGALGNVIVATAGVSGDNCTVSGSGTLAGGAGEDVFPIQYQLG